MENNQTNSRKVSSKKNSREQLAKQVSIFSISGVTLLGLAGIVISLATDKVEFERISYIYGIIFPLIGTWMGTVLAYYFSKDNFEAANQSVQNLVSHVTAADKLKAIQADEVWIPLSSMRYMSVSANADQVTVGEIVQFLDQKDANRLPILNQAKVIQYLIHRSTIENYITHRIMDDGISAEQVKKETITDMIKNGNNKIKQILTNGKGFISLDATLLDARNIMNDNKSIQDVFATQGGNSDAAVVGWITNTIIAEKARL